ncbi:MAG TPA: glycosyltransferase family 39 protein [Anaerolineae bacterium]
MLASVSMKTKAHIVGLIGIGALVLITFYPTLRIGFYGDDWWLIANAGKLTLPQYLRFYFDPSAQTIWYRPASGMLLLVEYFFFGPNPEGYHFVYILVHLINSLLLLALVYRISRNWQAAFISAILYAVLYPGSIAVFSTTIHDPLANLFYLLTLLFWLDYLVRPRRTHFLLTAIFFVLALLSKETSAGLIVMMFLVDRIIVSASSSIGNLVRRYALFGVILLGYLLIEYRVQVQGHFTNRAGYAVGPQMIENALHYLGLLVWPWSSGQPIVLISIALVALLLIGMTIRDVDPRLKIGVLFCLGMQVLLFLLPVLGFPVDLFEQRYLYPVSVVSAILIALFFTLILKRGATWRWTRWMVAAGIVLLTLLHSSSTADAAVGMAELNRESRVSFRDIVQQHPAFPPDTYLYFIDPPGLLRHFAPSMFFFRYGSNVSVWSVDPQWWGTIDDDRIAGLREHRNSLVIYYDDALRRHEVGVDPSADSTSQPSVPVDFQMPIRLAGYDLPTTKVKRGDALVLLLYWRAMEKIGKDYTVFVHLRDRNGNIVAGEDSQPRNGQAPTSKWRAGKLLVDPYILPITSAVPVDDGYELEIGLYYLPTMERLGIIDPAGRISGDAIVIQSISVQD